jgi:hypothetical protein
MWVFLLGSLEDALLRAEVLLIDVLKNCVLVCHYKLSLKNKEGEHLPYLTSPHLTSPKITDAKAQALPTPFTLIASDAKRNDVIHMVALIVVNTTRGQVAFDLAAPDITSEAVAAIGANFAKVCLKPFCRDKFGRGLSIVVAVLLVVVDLVAQLLCMNGIYRNPRTQPLPSPGDAPQSDRKVR